MDYYSAYNTLCLFFETDVSYITLQYIFVKCHDCNDMYVDEYYECACEIKIFRCKHHTFLRTIQIESQLYCSICIKNQHMSKRKNIRISCKYIGCHNDALYGYKDIVCYCRDHADFIKTIFLNAICCQSFCINKMITSLRCDIHRGLYELIDYSDKTLSRLSNYGDKCSFCKRTYIGLIQCKCKKYCSYCFVLCVWKQDGEYVCNTCFIENKKSVNHRVWIGLKCHNGDCKSNINFGIYGVALFCSDHYNRDTRLGELVYMNSSCFVRDCRKNVVHDHKCFDHTAKKMRKKIMYMIS